jgi:hypothetical protein
LTGSPLAHLRFPERMPAFIRLLSQAIPLEEAARRLAFDRETISGRLMRFRLLIEPCDPDGQWITRVKLGLRYRLHGTCPHRDYGGELKSGGFGGNGQRHAMCPACTRA